MIIARVLGILMVIGGIVLVFVSGNIADRVAEGRGEIRSGQEKVDATNKLFSYNRGTEFVGDQLTGSAQEKINAGTQEADKYDRLANNLQLGGYVVAGLGVIIFALSFIRRKK